MLVGKPGLDGHSNGAEQIAVRARDAGFEVVYEGIRLTPAQIANAALEEGVHVVGLSILSGSHVALVSEVLVRLKAAGLGDLPVVVGGIIPPEDAAKLARSGRRPRLYAQGLRPQRHHGRHRRPHRPGEPRSGLADQTFSVTSLVRAALLPPDRIIRKGPDQVPGMLQRPAISVPSSLTSPVYCTLS